MKDNADAQKHSVQRSLGREDKGWTPQGRQSTALNRALQMRQTRGVTGDTLLRVLQCKGRQTAQTTTAVKQAAKQGIEGGSQAMPHLGAIQRAFGSHDVSHVQAHVGGPAKQASEQIGAEAYATGNHVAFKQEPSLHTAAHEAAHVVQQRGGVQLKGGVGQVGDAYEVHADAVADRVVAGKSAEGLLSTFAPKTTSGQGTSSAVQRQTPDNPQNPEAEEVAAPAGGDLAAPLVLEPCPHSDVVDPEARRFSLDPVSTWLSSRHSALSGSTNPADFQASAKQFNDTAQFMRTNLATFMSDSSAVNTADSKFAELGLPSLKEIDQMRDEVTALMRLKSAIKGREAKAFESAVKELQDTVVALYQAKTVEGAREDWKKGPRTIPALTEPQKDAINAAYSPAEQAKWERKTRAEISKITKEQSSKLIKKLKIQIKEDLKASLGRKPKKSELKAELEARIPTEVTAKLEAEVERAIVAKAKLDFRREKAREIFSAATGSNADYLKELVEFNNWDSADKIPADAGGWKKPQDWCAFFDIKQYATAGGLDPDIKKGMLAPKSAHKFFEYKYWRRVPGFIWIEEEKQWKDLKAYHKARGSVRTWIPRAKGSIIKPESLRSGDFVIIDNKSSGKPHHVAMVDSVDGNILTTIEGNIYGLQTDVDGSIRVTTKQTDATSGVGLHQRDMTKKRKSSSSIPGYETGAGSTIEGVGRFSIVDFEEHSYPKKKDGEKKPKKPPVE